MPILEKKYSIEIDQNCLIAFGMFEEVTSFLITTASYCLGYDITISSISVLWIRGSLYQMWYNSTFRLKSRLGLC